MSLPPPPAGIKVIQSHGLDERESAPASSPWWRRDGGRSRGPEGPQRRQEPEAGVLILLFNADRTTYSVTVSEAAAPGGLCAWCGQPHGAPPAGSGQGAGRDTQDWRCRLAHGSGSSPRMEEGLRAGGQRPPGRCDSSRRAALHTSLLPRGRCPPLARAPGAMLSSPCVWAAPGSSEAQTQSLAVDTGEGVLPEGGDRLSGSWVRSQLV